MNMYWHELKAYRKSTFIWSFSLIGLIVLFLAMFPTFANDADDFKKLLEGYPPQVMQALDVSLGNFFTILGFYSYIFSYVVLCSSIQAMNLGISILSKEVREKTADFLLTKPVSRTQIITAKILAALTTFTTSNIVYIGFASIMATIVAEETFDNKVFLLISLSAFLVGLMFMALGILVSVILSKIKSVLPISLCTVFVFFILKMFGSVIGDEAINYITPFKYYDTAYIIENAAYDPKFLVIEIVFIFAAVLASYFIYLKKDIHAV